MRWIVAIAVAALLSWGAFLLAYPTYSYRWRVTVEVRTAAGVKTGSSVLETRTVQVPRWLTMGTAGSWTNVRGEGTFVELGEGRNLIALLAVGPHAADDRADLFAPRAFFPVEEGSPLHVKWSKTLSTMSGRRPYGPPTLITFGDLNDPATVQEVPYGEVARVLGPDVLDVRAWVELTKDNVTRDLAPKLPWMRDANAVRIVRNAIRSQTRGSSDGPSGLFFRDKCY